MTHTPHALSRRAPIESRGIRVQRRGILGLPLAMVLAAGSSAPARPDEAGVALPISRVVLYGSGVGSFELRGTARGDELAHLTFNVDAINDILKSLVVLDLDGGQPGTIVFDSREPLARRLTTFGVDISDAPSIPMLFARLRGASVRVSVIDSTIDGVILGTEERLVPAPVAESAPSKQMFVNIVTPAGIRSVQVSAITSFSFTDPALAAELDKALAALAQQRTEREKSLTLSLRGQGDQPRRIVVTYTREMPVWKSSYRLVLPPDGAANGDAPQAALQGWAIVENTTDTDWTDVRLSLASGRPVSFTMDLYTPLFVDRPDVPVPFLVAAAPRVYEDSMNRGRSDLALDNLRGARGASGEALSDMAAAPSLAMAEKSMAGFSRQLQQQDIIESAARAAASATNEGRQFVYTIDSPVTIERQTSAMLPIITDRVKGRRVAIYNPQSLELHPMRGFEFSAAASNLMPGPVSVYDGGTYAGDAQIPHTSAGQSRLLSYAVDLDISVRADPTTTQKLTKLRIVDGLLEQTFAQRQTTVYAIKSQDAEHPRIVLVEHPRQPGWTLVEPSKPVEETPSNYRFEAEVPPLGEQTLTVATELVTSSSTALVSFETPVILELAQSGVGSPKVVEMLKKLAEVRSRSAALARSVQEVEQERVSIEQDQSRLRSNMNSIDRTSELYRRYLAKLAEQETAIEGMIERHDELVKQLDAVNEEFRAAVAGLNLE